MSDHESALQKALIGWLKDDAALKALLGEPARIWDEPPKVWVSEPESWPVAESAGGGGRVRA